MSDRRTRNRRTARAVVVAVTAMVLAAVSTALVASHTSAPGDAPTISAHEPIRIGRTPDRERITFDLVLRMPGQAAFDAYARGVDTPGSPDFRHFLEPVEIGKRFGLSDEALSGLDAELARRRLAVVERYPERTALRVSGTADAVEAAFSLVLDEYRDPTHHARYHQPRSTPRLDPSLRHLVRGISGLNSRPPALAESVSGDIATRATPAGSTAAGTAPLTSLTPDVLARAYEIAPLHAQGLDGSGQYVAILSIADLSDADVDAWDQATGTAGAPPIERVRVGTGPLSNDPVETALDVDTVRAVAPKAQIIVFNVSPSSPTFLAEALREVLRDGRATIFSASFSACDAARAFETQHWDRESSLQAVKAARLAGVNLVFSTGDWGAYPCRGKHQMDDLVPTIAFPADTEYVTSVGGTTLRRGADGSYIDESGWEDPLSLSGGGGGLSPSEKQPAWQRGPGVRSSESTGRRQVPDVAAPADPGSGYFTVVTRNGSRLYAAVGGTSGATPFWAGLLAVYEQSTQRAGLGRLGFVNPTLYAIAATSAPNTVFHDVVFGGNLLFNAAPGWDFSTGLGTPIALPLRDAIVAYLRVLAAG